MVGIMVGVEVFMAVGTGPLAVAVIVDVGLGSTVLVEVLVGEAVKVAVKVGVLGTQVDGGDGGAAHGA